MKYISSKRGISILSVVIASAIIITSLVWFTKSIPSVSNVSERDYKKALAGIYVSELLEFFVAMGEVEILEYLSTPTTGLITYPDNERIPDLYPLCAHINILDRASGEIVNPDPLADLPPNNELNGIVVARDLAALAAIDPNLNADRDIRGRQLQANRWYQIQVVNLDNMTELNRWPITMDQPASGPHPSSGPHPCTGAPCGGNSPDPTAANPTCRVRPAGCNATEQCLCLLTPDEIFFRTNIPWPSAGCFAPPPLEPERRRNVRLDSFTRDQGSPSQFGVHQRLLVTVGVSWVPKGQSLEMVENVVLSSVIVTTDWGEDLF